MSATATATEPRPTTRKPKIQTEVPPPGPTSDTIETPSKPAESAENAEPKPEKAPAPQLKIAAPKPRDEVDLDRIDEARMRAQQARYAFNNANFTAKKLKKVMDGAYEDLDLILAEELGPQEPHLFNQPAKSTDGKKLEEDDSWKEVPLSSIGLAPAIVKSLGEAGLNTIGELSAYTEPSASGFTKKLTDIDGIGPLKAETIERALEQFWEERAKAEDSDDGDTDEGGDEPQE